MEKYEELVQWVMEHFSLAQQQAVLLVELTQKLDQQGDEDE